MYRGYAYEKLGRFKQAIEDLKKCVELIDNSMNSNSMYAMLLEGTKNNVQKRLAVLIRHGLQIRASLSAIHKINI